MNRKATSGVTLFELLAVIALLAVLATLVLGAVGMVRNAGMATECVSKLRTIYQVSLAFAQDHNGLLPVPLAKNDNTSSKVHPSYTVNAYWWDTAYLGRYMLNDFGRSRYNVGRLRSDEMGSYRCPARLLDGPDAEWESVSSHVSYVMVRRPFTPENHRLMTMENKSERIYITEGRYSVIAPPSRTGQFGEKDSSARLRRYHGGGLNLLFLDGHIERFKGTDDQLTPMMQPEI